MKFKKYRPSLIFFLYIIFLVDFLFIGFHHSLHARLKVDFEERFKSWVAPAPEIQLAREGKDDQKGLGRIFVPVMTSSETEPYFDVYQNGKLYQAKNLMGKSLYVPPGQYTVHIGNLFQGERTFRKFIVIRDGQTKIIYPEWSGLIVRIVEPTRKYLVQSYEIFNMHNKESLGINISKDESEPGEKPDTWILSPGRYKITQAGYPFNTSMNFSTLDVLPGQLYQWTIVMDEYTNNFVGAGFLEEMNFKTLNKSYFTMFSSLSGSLNAFNSNKQQREKFITTYNVTINFDNRIQYDDGTHFILLEPAYDLILSQEEKNEPRVYSDDFSIDNIYIYYLTRIFGFYSRADIQTHLFPEKVYFSSEIDTLQSKDSQGNVIEYNNILEFQVSPRFSPLILKEGFGINFTPFRSSNLRLSLRTGIGFRQNIYSNSFEKSDDGDYLYSELSSLYIYGYELTGRIYARLLSKLLFSFKYDVLFPFDREQKADFEIDASLSYRLLKYFSLEYTLSYNQGQGRSYGVWENNFWLKFSYIFYQ